MEKKSLADPELCRVLLAAIQRDMRGPVRFMEVCGTHTAEIFRSGIRSLLPEGLEHVSGPGCPVCVTHESDIGTCLNLAQKDDVIIATFGDLMRVPGPQGARLLDAKTDGARVSIVYSPLEALDLAERNPGKSVVFLGIGFETTTPAVAATILEAARRGTNNFFVFSCHKQVPPVLACLLSRQQTADSPKIDALLLPGHVSTVIGSAPYLFIPVRHGIPAVIGGFEPADILQSLLLLVRMHATGVPALTNQYLRGAAPEGNQKAQRLMKQVFQTEDAVWRGLGSIPGSGLGIRPSYVRFDARAAFSVSETVEDSVGICRCGQVLTGSITPPECPFFGVECTPEKPAGPCMVSTEGSCAAYYAYGY